jgi:hypothetical protein
VLPHLFDQFHATHAWHVEIGHDHVGRHLGQLTEGDLTVFCSPYFVAL